MPERTLLRSVRFMVALAVLALTWSILPQPVRATDIAISDPLAAMQTWLEEIAAGSSIKSN
jgi:hypothetical protein